jgi:FMN phosphatase YigB (HAD superfamily)
MPTVQVVGIDLDDTLLRLAPDFIPRYLAALDAFMVERLGLTQSVMPALLATTQAVTQAPGRERWLSERFLSEFYERTGIAPSCAEALFQQFFATQFARFESLSRPVYGSLGLLAAIRQQGYPVVLVTSPLFPEVAVRMRLAWAGLDGFPFLWFSAFERVHASKPQPDFYRDVADIVGIDPGYWLMVGNDLAEDIVPASQVGMQVHWVTWTARAPHDRLPPAATYGPLAGVFDVLRG